jgi:hypothetical protein
MRWPSDVSEAAPALLTNAVGAMAGLGRKRYLAVASATLATPEERRLSVPWCSLSLIPVDGIYRGSADIRGNLDTMKAGLGDTGRRMV